MCLGGERLRNAREDTLREISQETCQFPMRPYSSLFQLLFPTQIHEMYHSSSQKATPEFRPLPSRI